MLFTTKFLEAQGEAGASGIWGGKDGRSEGRAGPGKVPGGRGNRWRKPASCVLALPLPENISQSGLARTLRVSGLGLQGPEGPQGLQRVPTLLQGRRSGGMRPGSCQGSWVPTLLF